MTSEQYLNLPVLKAQFVERLRSWGLDSDEPIATTIVAHSDEEIGELIRSRPNSDFLLSMRVWNRLGEVKTHRVSDSSGHVLLLAR